MKKNSLLNFLSDTGYKRNSPDVNRPLNVIPSGRITMQDVDFPVRGVDNLGNEMFMMPGGEYFFPGDYVVETPMMQRGGLTFQQYYTPAAESTGANYTPTMTVQAAERLKAMRDAQELARRKQAIQASQAAASRSFRERLTPENLAQETGATGDKLRFFPNDPDSFIDDYLNPLKMVGDMASGLGRIPLNVKQGNYGAAALDVAIPVATGALAGLGAKSAGQFVNNLANPLAGTGQFLTTKTPLRNAYKILGNNTRFFNPGETPHWIKGYQQDWNPMIADLEPLANFRQQQATRILSNTKMFKESEAIRNKYADKLDELFEQKKSFLKSNDKDAVLDANRQIAEIFNNRDKDFDDLNKKYFTSKEHPFDTRLGSGSYGSVYGLPKLNYAVKVGNLPKGEDAYKLVELSKNIEKSNIAVPKRAYNTSSGENVMVMSKVDPIQGNFALNPPIEQSYRELIKDVEALRNKGLYLDFQNPENIRYNPSTGLFNIYDLNSTGYILGKNINEKSYDVSKKTVEELLAEHKLIPEQLNTPGVTFYNEIPKQLPGSPNAFKSEIDWAKWNPETPNYPELINEYNAIEESTKKAGTWMKNADGSPFEGTPEQFIQQQSSWFKKAFPNPVRKERPDFYSNEISGGVNPKTYFDENQPVQYNYHGSPNKFDFFDENKFSTGAFGKGIYTSKRSNPGYGENIYQLYLNANNPQPVNYTKPYDLFSADELNAVIKQKLLDYKNMHGFDFKGNPRDLLTYGKDMNKPKILSKAGYQQLEPGRDYFNPAQEPNQSVVPFSNYPKSAKGNVGFFDMTNPNIYKAAAPIGIGLGTTTTQEYQKGGQQVGTDILDKYKSYIMGDYKPEEEKDLKNTYDKLNRHYYKKAKETGKSVPNYIMSLL